MDREHLQQRINCLFLNALKDPAGLLMLEYEKRMHERRQPHRQSILESCREACETGFFRSIDGALKAIAGLEARLRILVRVIQ